MIVTVSLRLQVGRRLGLALSVMVIPTLNDLCQVLATHNSIVKHTSGCQCQYQWQLRPASSLWAFRLRAGRDSDCRVQLRQTDAVDQFVSHEKQTAIKPRASRDREFLYQWIAMRNRVSPLVLPARLCGAAAGNRSHRYIGKVCCLLLVRAEYIGRAPGRGPEGTGNCSSCYGCRE